MKALGGELIGKCKLDALEARLGGQLKAIQQVAILKQVTDACTEPGIRRRHNSDSACSM
jgi:hypothetical protein